MSTASTNDRTMALNEFFTASEARVDRWRTLNRVARALAGTGRAAGGRSRPGPEGAARRARAAGGALRLSRTPADGPGARAPADRGLDRLRAPGAADQRRAARQQLPGRPGGVEGRRGGRGASPRHPAAVDRPRPGPPAVLRDPARLARRAGDVAGDPGDLPPAAARRGRVRLRAGRGRQLRGRGARRRLQPQSPGGRDQRRLRLPLAVHGAGAARDPHPSGAGRRGRAERRSRGPPGADGAPVAAGARRLPHDRPRRRPAGRLRRGGAHPADLLRGRGADGDPPGDPRRREGPLRDAVLRQPQAVRPAPDRHLPRAAGGPRQVDLQVELDPRHGRVLRGQPVPRRVVGDHRRPRQPARADRQHQGRAGQGGPRPRRRPQLLRHQRHVDVEQDRPPGAAAGRATSC